MPIATSDALLGLGMPAQLAAVVGANPHVLTTTGTAQNTAATLKSQNTELLTAASQTGAIAPATHPIMQAFYIVCPTATSAVVYVPSNHTLNATLNGSVTLAQNKAVILWQYKRNFWTYILTA